MRVERDELTRKEGAAAGRAAVPMLLVILGVLSAAASHLALAEQCSNEGPQASNCEVQYTTVPLPQPHPLVPDWVQVSPVNLTGGSSCTTSGDGCGYAVGTGPVAVGGSSSCGASNGCGLVGTGPVAVGGGATCSTGTGSGCGHTGTSPIAVGGGVTCTGSCGAFGTGPVAIGGGVGCTVQSGSGCGSVGTGPVAVGGDAQCSAGDGCGVTGTGPVSVGGDAECTAGRGCGAARGTGPVSVGGTATCTATTGCGYMGTGPIATGNVTCHGTCGAAGTTDFPSGVPLPRTGTPGTSVAGSATCDVPFDAGSAANPATAAGHLQSFECVSPLDVAAGIS